MTIATLPALPSEASVDAWHTVVGAAHLHDLPSHVSPPGRVETAGKLRRPPVRSRAVHRVAVADDGSYDGVASLVLFTDGENRHTAFLEQLVVHPRARRRGTGTRLWNAVRGELTANGRTSVSTMLELGGAGEVFASRRGFACALPLAWHVQDVHEALADRPVAPDLPDGYSRTHWTGVVPDPLADAFAEAHNAMQDAPLGEVEQSAPAWDAARVRAAARVIEERGGVLLSSAVLHTRAGTATVAAYTELVLKDPSDVRALQYDTAVVPAHRGHGLGVAVKRHMMGVVAAERPGVREIATTVADENGPMLAVNERLGYRRERDVGYFQAKL